MSDLSVNIHDVTENLFPQTHMFIIYSPSAGKALNYTYRYALKRRLEGTTRTAAMLVYCVSNYQSRFKCVKSQLKGAGCSGVAGLDSGAASTERFSAAALNSIIILFSSDRKLPARYLPVCSKLIQ